MHLQHDKWVGDILDKELQHSIVIYTSCKHLYCLLRILWKVKSSYHADLTQLEYQYRSF